MKWLWLLLAIPLHAQLPMGGVTGSGSSGPTIVQSHICAGSFATSTTCAFSSNVTSGNIIVVWAFAGGTVSGWTAATGSGTGCSSTTFTTQGTPGTGAEALAFGTASGTGSCTVTTPTATGASDNTGAVYEISGGTTTGTVLSAYGSTNCTTCTGSGLTTTATSLVLTFMIGGGPYSAPSPFTYDINTTDGLGFNIGAGHFAQSASGSYTPTWTNTNNATVNNVSLAIP